MRTIAHRDLRNRSSEILRDVQAGESFEITNHGEVVAVLIPVAAAAQHAGLKLRPATRADRFVVPTALADLASEEVLDDLRGDA